MPRSKLFRRHWLGAINSLYVGASTLDNRHVSSAAPNACVANREYNWDNSKQTPQRMIVQDAFLWQHPVQASGILFQNILFIGTVAKRVSSSVKRSALLREEAGRTVSDTAGIDEEIDAFCETEGRIGQ
jgi:hypothetical protein